jgi:hypothetical protein
VKVTVMEVMEAVASLHSQNSHVPALETPRRAICCHVPFALVTAAVGVDPERTISTSTNRWPTTVPVMACVWTVAVVRWKLPCCLAIAIGTGITLHRS